MIYIVLVEFKKKLNEDRIASNITAAKKTINTVGTTCVTINGYASSIMLIFVPFNLKNANAMIKNANAMTLGRDKYIKPMIFNVAHNNAPFCASFRSFAANTCCT